MKFPVQFLLAAQQYKEVLLLSDDFPDDINKQLDYCSNTHCFSSTLWLPSGTYRYQFLADNTPVTDTLRTNQEGIATIEIGADQNSGIIFDLNKSFVKNNHLVLVLGLDKSIWIEAFLNIQTIQGMQVIYGKSTFIEGSTEYFTFVFDIPEDDSVFAFFELIGHHDRKFYGENGVKDNEWSTSPFEIKEHRTSPIKNSNITSIYHLDTPKSVIDFEKHITYFEKFPINYISGEIPENSTLLKNFNYFQQDFDYSTLTCLLRNIFLETEDFHASLGLLGRFAYEYRQDISTIPFALSDHTHSFWELTHRNFKTMSRAVGFQLLGSMTPKIFFGEEIGLHKTGLERVMLWTKTKWNKNLYNFYQKLLKLRKKYPVLRQGRFRLVIQDCNLWGIERYMTGEDSIFIFGNHSKNNIIVDLTSIMNFNGPIVELLSESPIKRKKVCTIFAESIVAFKQNSSKNISKHSLKEEFLAQEDDAE